MCCLWPAERGKKKEGGKWQVFVLWWAQTGSIHFLGRMQTSSLKILYKLSSHWGVKTNLSRGSFSPELSYGRTVTEITWGKKKALQGLINTDCVIECFHSLIRRNNGVQWTQSVITFHIKIEAVHILHTFNQQCVWHEHVIRETSLFVRGITENVVSWWSAMPMNTSFALYLCISLCVMLIWQKVMKTTNSE